MRKLIIFMVVIIVIIALMLFVNTNKEHEKTLATFKTKQNESIEDKAEQKEKSIELKIEGNNKYNVKSKRTVTSHLQVFNSNPAIDSVLLDLNFAQCIDYLNNNEDKFGINSFKINKNKSINQDKFKQSYDKYCEGLDSKNPQYLLTKNNERKILAKSLDINTSIGKIISGHYNGSNNFENFDISEKIKQLKNTDPNLLLKATRYFREYNDKYVYPEIKILIGSNDGHYISLIMKYANNMYACYAGASCTEYSSLVAKLCINDNLCGSSYSEIMNTLMSDGVRADIQIAYEYLSKIYGQL